MRDVEILPLADGRAALGRTVGLGHHVWTYDVPTFLSVPDAQAFLRWYEPMGMPMHRAGLFHSRWLTERDWPECDGDDCTARVEGGGLCKSCKAERVSEMREVLTLAGKAGPHA